MISLMKMTPEQIKELSDAIRADRKLWGKFLLVESLANGQEREELWKEIFSDVHKTIERKLSRSDLQTLSLIIDLRYQARIAQGLPV